LPFGKVEELINSNELARVFVKLNRDFLEACFVTDDASPASEVELVITVVLLLNRGHLLQLRLRREAVQAVKAHIGSLNLAIVARLLGTVRADVKSVGANVLRRLTFRQLA